MKSFKKRKRPSLRRSPGLLHERCQTAQLVTQLPGIHDLHSRGQNRRFDHRVLGSIEAKKLSLRC